MDHIKPGPVDENKRKAARLYSSASGEAEVKLIRPFKCPGAATTRDRAQPARKRRKVNYAEGGGDGKGPKGDSAYTGDGEREPLGNRDLNKYPVFEVKDKDVVFRKKFSVPIKGGYTSNRPAPALGMRIRANFVPKPLHDPAGEFAIVLYDPTVDDKPAEEEVEEEVKEEEEKPVSKVHKSLADILGLKNEKQENPKVPVVIDPRLAKVLRPHQIEGVKVPDTFDHFSLALAT